VNESAITEVGTDSGQCIIFFGGVLAELNPLFLDAKDARPLFCTAMGSWQGFAVSSAGEKKSLYMNP